jgi:hypothetical protein
MIIKASRKQKNKIFYLGSVAAAMYPQITHNRFKNAFIEGVEYALKTHSFSRWSDVAKELPLVRKGFFDSILQKMRISLKKSDLEETQVESLMHTLGKKNRRYLG